MSDGVEVSGMFVSVGAVVAEGGKTVAVTVKVAVDGCVGMDVAVLGMLVIPGVLVGTLGTQSNCPT